MTTRGRDLERTAGTRLTANVGEVGNRRATGFVTRLDDARQRLDTARMAADVEQARRVKDPSVADERGLGGVARRHDQRVAVARRLQRVGSAPRMPCDRPAERELTVQLRAVEACLRQLRTGDEDADGNRQVEPAALLRQVRGREVDGDAPDRKFKAAVGDRGAHAILAFLDHRLRQPDDRELRQPAARVDLDAHERRVEALLGPAQNRGERHTRIRSWSVELVDIDRACAIHGQRDRTRQRAAATFARMRR